MILIISPFNINSRKGSPLRFRYIYEAILKKNKEILVVSPSNLNNVTFKSFNGINKLTKKFSIFQFLLKQFQARGEIKLAKKIVCITPTSAFIPIILIFLYRLSIKKIFIDVHGLIESEHQNNSPGLILLKLIEKFCLRYSQNFIVVSNPLKDYIRKINSDARIIVKPFLVKEISKNIEYNNDDYHKTIYFGGAQPWQNLSKMEYEFNLNKNVFDNFYLVGNCCSLYEKFGINLIGDITDEQLNLLKGRFGWGISFREPSKFSSSKYQIASKLTTYWSLGLLIIAPINSNEAKYVIDSGGILYGDGHENFANAFRRIQSMSKEEYLYRINICKEYVKNNHLMDNYYECIT
jgi:hypothetical protein